jgi:twitching motility two-component system response regulator PilH
MARILVVDDHPAIVRLLQRVLQRDGHEVLTAADGEEALERARQALPALVFLDVAMPGKDGYAVLSELRSDPATRPVPVILLTGQDQEQDVARGLQWGADWHLTKPFSPAEILSLARRFLGPEAAPEHRSPGG